MQDRSIDNALLALRKQIIRGDGEGLEHVEALLTLRGIPMPRVYPAKCPTTARKGSMALMLLEALRSGPKARPELVTYVEARRPEVPADRLYWRTDAALAKLHRRGLVRREGRVWVIHRQDTV